ncbi:MAG: hypothetical protein ACRDV9_14990, partial [Acidimicrobiia bacterium]
TPDVASLPPIGLRVYSQLVAIKAFLALPAPAAAQTQVAIPTQLVHHLTAARATKLETLLPEGAHFARVFLK